MESSSQQQVLSTIAIIDKVILYYKEISIHISGPPEVYSSEFRADIIMWSGKRDSNLGIKHNTYNKYKGIGLEQRFRAKEINGNLIQALVLYLLKHRISFQSSICLCNSYSYPGRMWPQAKPRPCHMLPRPEDSKRKQKNVEIQKGRAGSRIQDNHFKPRVSVPWHPFLPGIQEAYQSLLLKSVINCQFHLYPPFICKMNPVKKLHRVEFRFSDARTMRCFAMVRVRGISRVPLQTFLLQQQ